MLSKTYIKYIQSLHQKKFRDIESAFFAEGVKVVKDLLYSGTYDCNKILIVADWWKNPEANFLKPYSDIITEIEDFEMEKVSAMTTPGKILAVFSKKKPQDVSLKGKLTLVLDNIQDPGNFGTIIRIADWFGIENIVCAETCADKYNPKVVQSTMGSLGRVNIVYTSLGKWIAEASREAAVYAATLNGRGIKTIAGITEGILVIGNESKGISEEILSMARYHITIPRKGSAESLNAAVATGIILSHI